SSASIPRRRSSSSLSGSGRDALVWFERGSSSVGRASASQAEGREFEPRLPLRIRFMAATQMRHTLPGRDYWDPEIYELDRERIFFRHWFYVGRIDGLTDPGQFIVADVAGESIIVIRGKDDELRGFYNVCRHRGSRLCEDPASGRIKGAIKCPYHAWTY